MEDVQRRGAPRRAAISLILALLMAVPLAGTALAGASGDPQTGFSANAYGTYAFVGDVVVAGKSAVSGLGCTAVAGAHDENTVGSTNVPPLFGTGTVFTTADAISDGVTDTAKSTATTQGANLLAGLILAQEVRAVSASSHGPGGFSVSAQGSRFIGLVVAGIPIQGTPAPNTQINLLGFGKVVLNEQISRVSGSNATLTVNMIHVTIDLPNILDIPVGTQIIVSHAQSSLRLKSGTLGGFAYGTQVRVSDLVLSGPTAKVSVGCLGTNGNIKTNNIVGLSLPPIFTVGEVTSTAQGTLGQNTASVHTTNTVENVNLAGGLVTATLIKAAANAERDQGGTDFSSDGSMFTNLHVSGFPLIGDDVEPNTRLNIAGLGTLWLYRVIEKSNSIEVRMVQLIVDTVNPLGIPVGADIRISVANARID